MAMNVLIAEANWNGHRLNHVGTLLQALLALPDVRVTLALAPGARASRPFAEWLAPRLAGAGAGAATIRETLPEPIESYRPQWIRAASRAIARDALATGADHVLVPSGDGVVQTAAVLRAFGQFPRRKGCEFEAMMLRGGFAYHRGPQTLRSRLSRATWLTSVRASPFVRVHHMDPVVYEAAIAASPSIATKLRSIPDPVDPIEAELTTTQAREKLGLPTGGRMFGCAGFLHMRKGIGLMVRSVARLAAAGRLRDDDRLVLIGEPEDSVAALLDGEAAELIRSGRIIARRQFVDDVALSNAISALDVMVVAYPGHIGSASFALRAAAQRRPVLADRFGWCGLMVPKFGLGLAVDAVDDAAFDDGVVATLDASERRGDAVDPRAAALMRYSSTPNFVAHWLARIRERLDLPAEPTIAWRDIANAKNAGAAAN